MEYETSLPSRHLGGASILVLEDILLEECTDPELATDLELGRVTHRYSSAESLVRDVVPPSIVRSFAVRSTSREGRIEPCIAGQERAITLAIAGDGDWTESRRRRIESFFERHGSGLRTLLERYTPIRLTLFTIVGAFCSGIRHLLLNVVYPYALVVTRSGVRRLPVARRDGPADP